MIDERTRSTPADEPTTAQRVQVGDGSRGRRFGWLRRPWVIPVTLAVVLVALLVTSAVIWLRGRETVDQGAVAVARQEAQNFFSLDYHHPDADLDRVLSLAADPFKKQYSDQRAAVKNSLVDKKLVVTATVPDDGAAVEYQHGDTAQVLVAVDAKTATDSGGTDDNRYRARINLAKTNGTWLVTGVNQVG